MNIKTVTLCLLLVTISACSTIAPIENKSLRLIDGSSIIIKNGKAIKITDITGATVTVKKGMMALANGDFIYIREDGTVKISEMNNAPHIHNSNSSNNNH